MQDVEGKDYDDFDLDQFNDELDYLDRYEQESQLIKQEESKHQRQRNAFDYDSDENEISRLDEDLEPEFRDRNNEETLQAHSYDRAFVVNGPVIKVYKNSEEIDKHQQKLQYLMHMPPLKDKSGHVFEPQNLLLHNNESSMLFIDKLDKNRLINFDLEAGKVVEEFNTEGKTD